MAVLSVPFNAVLWLPSRVLIASNVDILMFSPLFWPIYTDYLRVLRSSEHIYCRQQGIPAR